MSRTGSICANPALLASNTILKENERGEFVYIIDETRNAHERHIPSK